MGFGINNDHKKFYSTGPSWEQAKKWLLVKLLYYHCPSEAYVITYFTMVIYRHSMVTPSFCVVKLYYIGNYCGLGVIYHM
jgi:hypothetical protein